MTTFKKIDSRIESLFDDINVCTNYFAAKDHTCCNTCGHSEIEDEMKSSLGEEEAEKKKGYVFYHTQETDSIRDIDSRSIIGNSGNKELPIYLNFHVWGEKNDDDSLTERCKEMLYKLKPLAVSHNMRLEWAETMSKKMILYVLL